MTELATLPVAEEDLAQIFLDDRIETEPCSQRCSGLVGSGQRRDVDRCDPLARRDQPVGDLHGLRTTVGSQRRIGMPADQRERVALDQR